MPEGVDIAIMAGLVVKVLTDELRLRRNGNGKAWRVKFEEALTALTERVRLAEDKADNVHSDLLVDVAYIKGRLKGLPQGPEA